VSGFERDLLTGLAGVLNTAGAGTYLAPGTAYTPGATAITFGDMPDGPEFPDRCITLATYPLSDAPKEALSMIGVQVRGRGLPGDFLDATDLNVAIFNALHGLQERTFGTCYLIQLLRKTSIPMGMDGSKRWETSSNFYADINPPTTSLRPE
jgi:hypothetical protein